MRNLTNIIILIVALLVGAATDGYAQSKGPVIKGNVYGGGENAKVKGEGLGDAESTTSVTINNGHVMGDVFGAGKGVTVSKTPATGKDKDGNTIDPLTYDQIATVTGNTKVLIDSTTVEPIKKGTVWGNIYGGAENAIVNGNANVLIAGGKFASDVFGGGKGDVTTGIITAANVKKNTHVEVTAGEIVWNKKLGSDGELQEATVAEFFDNVNKKFLKDHNIYAGGDVACTVGTWNNDGDALTDPETGTSNLTMTRGLIGSDLLNSDEWKEAFAQHEDPHFYAFGGGYGIYTKAHKSDVKICLPMVGEEGVGGGDVQLVRPQRRAAQTLPLDIITDNYGVAWTTVLGILGGGYNGHVEQTNVLVGDATYAHRVYGGGLGSYEGWVEAGKPADMAAAAAAVGKVGTVGPLAGDPSETEPVAHVTLAGGHIHGEVFGGGAGVASGKEKQDGEGNWSIDRTVANNTFTDFTEIARVKGNTLVETTSYETYLTSEGTKDAVLDSHPNKTANTDPDESKQAAYPLYQRAQVFGHVYGGGDVANVSGNTNVKLFGGDVFGYTFGAGLGRLTTQANDYTLIGNVTGSSTLTTADLVDWTDTSLPGDYDEPYKPTAWNDVYGGGRNGVTNRNATVNINGGKLGNNIFGGGLGNVDGDDITSADVKGNTKVTVKGGSYQWREMADVNGNIKKFNDVAEEFDRNIIDNKMMLTPLLEPIEDFFDYRTASYTRDHSIYGGGNIACKVGTYASDDTKDSNGNITVISAPNDGTGKSTVDMQHGLFADTDIHWTDDDKWNLATLCRWLACENSSNYQFGVFGGGYGANTKVGETDVTLEMGKIGLEEEAASGDPSHYPSIWNTYMGGILTWANSLTDEQKDALYGGTTGVNATNRALTARMAHSINVPSHTTLTAAGGGFAGYVAGNTSVSLEQRSGALRIFGGGIGLRPTDTEQASLTQSKAEEKTYGQVGGNTKVNVEYGVVVKDVYGGGAGIESLQNGSGEYVDFTNMARVKGKTEVHVHATDNQPTQTLVYGRVFGGGDVANVGQDGDAVTSNMQSADILTNGEKLRTKVTVDAGCVFNDVFAGGSGRVSENCHDYTNLGVVFGNTQLAINQPEIDGENSTWLWKDVYGGGRNGIVKGNTLVEIKGGWLGSNVYGGGLGNVGSRYNLGTGMDEEVITAANVTQNTNVQVTGGQYCLSQMWNDVERSWAPMNKDDKDNKYSSQYDPTTNKFLVSHNIYGGGNVACTVGNDTWVDMTQGLLPKATSLGHKETTDFFNDENEWKNIHNKHASPYFSVFGGGYGGNTLVSHDSHVNIAMEAPSDADEYKPSNYQSTSNLSSVFLDRQSLLDVIGGGYEGAVNNICNVEINGNTFMRNVFGGAYYATVGGTQVDIKQGNIEDVYGGGMMGDVVNYAHVNVGQKGLTGEIATSNKQIVILKNVYGANDVSGLVGGTEDEFGAITPTNGCDGVVMNLYGGTVHGNVYGSGNGNYQYKLDQDVTKVTPLEDYHFTVGGRDAVETVYLTPVRQTNFPSLGAMSSAQKIVDITSYRPGVSKVDMDIKGNSADDRLVVKGSIFGGGNSATVSTFALKNDGVTPDYGVKMNLGSHVRANSLFFGSDGQELFNTENYFIANFEELNKVQLKSTIDWEDVRNVDISHDFLPVAADKRSEIYKTLLDLYFLPVEMDFMPEFTWNGQNNSVKLASGEDSYVTLTTSEFTDTELATFCCGGNRGNMNAETHFHVNFPEGLTITDKIVGGCNNANYKFMLDGEYDANGIQKSMTHEGGYLLGTHGVGSGREPQIHLTLRNKFRLEETDEEYLEACNVFGGCYESGTVRGDILVEVFSNMLHSAGTAGGGLNVEKLKAANSRNEDPNAERTNSVASVYGGGYGPNTWVYGDTEVRLGNNTDEHESVLAAHETQFNVTGSSCNFLFGGGCQGNIVGNTNVRMYNGRVAGCIVGASFKGSLYGNAQTMVGYPARYYRANKTGVFKLVRTDNSSDHADYRDENGNKIIRTEVYYTEGDLVPRVVYDEIVAEITEEMDEGGNVSWTETPLDDVKKAARFTMEHSIPGEEYKSAYDADPESIEGRKFNNWSNINIHIDKAIYGGGYAIMNGENSDPFTVKKYTDIPKEGDDRTYRFSNTQIEDTYHVDDPRLFNHYGGNTFVMLGDISGDYEKQAVADGESALAAMSTRDGSNPNKITAEGQRNKDHINISSRSLDPVSTSTGDDLFGLFYEMTNEERYGADYCSDHSLDPNAPSGSYMKMSYEAFKQASDQHKYYNFVGEGGVYGDGRLSLSEGFRTCEAIGYGYNGTTPEEPKLMNCIHRFDIARFKDCCISLLGDRDYASAEGQMPNAASYSIARVSEIVMESSIDQTKDYLTKDKKFSRNYIGLSNAQFDLAAIKSNVEFKPIDREHGEVPTANSYYHNKHGKVVENGMDVEGSEDDLGVAQKQFTREESYYDVKRWYLNEYEIGSGKSDYYDNIIAQVQNEKLFQLRNSATSKNMFGVFSGYALTVRNNYFDNAGAHPYWGPVHGVFEIDLIGTRNGEAGGYAYAQNIHDEDVTIPAHDEVPAQTVHTFLETSGNFVFPANETRKVVDNCFPTSYSLTERDAAEGHYWYVTGFRYFYNVNITGYTYDNDVRYFNMDNSSHLVFMPGAKAGQTVTLQNFHFLNRHSSDEKQIDCDIENKFLSGEYNSTRWNEPTTTELQAYCIEGKCSVHDGTGTHDDDIRAYWNERSQSNDFTNPFYNLSLSVSDKDVYSPETKVDESTVTVPHYESLIQDKFSMVDESDGKGGTVKVKKYDEQKYELEGKIPYNEPLISLQLKDVVLNNGMFDETTTYKDKYLSEPCQALLVLTTPVMNDKGQPVYDAYEPVPKKDTGVGNLDPSIFGDPANDNKYSILDFNGDYVALTAEEAGNQYDKGAILYTTASAKMLKVGDGTFVADRYYFKLKESGDPNNIGDLAGQDYDPKSSMNTGDWEIQTLTREQFDALSETDKAKLFYLRPNAKKRFYEYNLTITINYLKGPSHKGNINILNCALPGEMIRLRHNNIKIDTDPVSLRHNGNFWIIGPGKKVADDGVDIANGYHWELIDQTGTETKTVTDAEGSHDWRYYNKDTRNFYYPYNPWVDKIDAGHYQTPISSAVRDGMYHDTEDTNKPDYFIPAYYFMNGYVAQYAYTVANIDEIFVTKAYPMDTLLVHNYHRMLKANVETDRKDDIKLREAVLEMDNGYQIPIPEDATESEKAEIALEQKALDEQWANQHKRPRVYIQNQLDLTEFKKYVERSTDRVVAGETVLPATDYGAGIDVHLLADIEVPSDWTSISNFNGRLHGNGHVIKGLGSKSLFATLGEDVCIYNLGLPTGKIATTKGNAKYYCCYTFNTGEKDADQNIIHTVYRKDGSAVTTYADDDWRYGRVAYDLNEFYLAERLDRGEDGADAHDHSGYVEDLYGDGEYRMALYRLKDETETEYLRNQQEPNYQWGFDNDMVSAPDAISNHWYEYDEENRVLSHRVDEPRAYYTEAVSAVLYANVGEYNTAKGTSLDAAAFAALTDAQKTKTAAKPRMVSEFRPLIDEVKVNSTEEGLDAKKNDYIFFGQTLNVSAVTAVEGTVGTSLPAVISASANASMPGNSNNDGGMPVVTHNVNDQANRVWRAYGFYQSKKDDAFHFNRAAWALHPELTAIDFTGAHDSNHSWKSGMVAGNATKEQMFYPMVMDKPDNLLSFNVMSNRNYNEDGSERPIAQYDNSNYGRVTQNLLVYNNSEKTAGGTDVFTSTDVTIDDENITYSEEKDVHYHNLVFNSSAVDPAPKYSTDYFHLVDKQDFNAPIAFNVNTRAWYERLPQSYRGVDKGYGAGTAWEGIVLPFTATKVTAEKNGEISHFYGKDELHHEYWLRGLTTVDDHKATFARPAVSGSGNFVDGKQSGAEYTYPANTYFTNLYNYNPWFDTRDDEGEDTFGNHDKAWYAVAHTFDNYVHLTADVPYIVAFPGDDFYEFSMESYYKTGEYGNEPYKQKATFEVNSDDPDIVATTIKVSDDNEAKTIVGGKVHWGTFMHEVDQLGINKDGTAFETVPVSYNDGYVLPFRTYLGAESSPVKRYVISEPGKGDQPFEPNEPNANDSRPVFDISIDGLNVTVTSSYEDTRILDVYLVGGQLVLRHEAVPGTTHFRLPQQGAYIIGRKKYMVR